MLEIHVHIARSVDYMIVPSIFSVTARDGILDHKGHAGAQNVMDIIKAGILSP